MHIPTTGPGQTLVGVSIAIPEPWASFLVDARRSFGDVQADSVPPHVTIVGPTVVDNDLYDEMIAHLESVVAKAEPFQVILRGTGTFRPTSPVVFVNVVQGIVECERLEAAAVQGLLAQRKRFRYHPHVTVAQDVSGEALDRAFDELADFQAGFDVAELWLYEHDDAGVWQRRRAFPLGSRSRGNSDRIAGVGDCLSQETPH
jgi:2'-5' RNA ligase